MVLVDSKRQSDPGWSADALELAFYHRERARLLSEYYWWPFLCRCSSRDTNITTSFRQLSRLITQSFISTVTIHIYDILQCMLPKYVLNVRGWGFDLLEGQGFISQQQCHDYLRIQSSYRSCNLVMERWRLAAENSDLFKDETNRTANQRGRAILSVGLGPLTAWDCGFESRLGVEVYLLWVLCVVR